MDLWSLLNQVKGAIYNDPTTPHQPGNDPSGLISQIEGLFSKHAESQGTTIRPASEDPYGDPGANDRGNYGYLGGSNVPAGVNVRPASEDPLGDPADNSGGGGYSNIRPASEDPLGDPADTERR